MERGSGIGSTPLPAHYSDRSRSGARNDPVVTLRVLGTYGSCNHGRTDHCDSLDAFIPACALCRMVPSQEARTGGGNHPLNTSEPAVVRLR